MLFKFLEKKVVLNCFVHEKYSALVDLLPIQPAHRFIPDWYKSLPTPHFNQSTMNRNLNIKSCLGFLNMFRTGYMIPMWSDLAINVDKVSNELIYKYTFSDGKSILNTHADEHAGNFYTDHFKFKLLSPWFIECDNDIKFILTDCLWNSTDERDYVVPTGITRFNKYDNLSTNIFMLVKKQKQRIFINAGQPMIHIIPMTERNTRLQFEVLSDKQFNKKSNALSSSMTFCRKAINAKRLSESKCPIKTFLKND